MILMRILPAVLKELSKHVPAVLFQTVEWSELASELPKISRRIIQKEGYEELFLQQEKLMATYNIVLTTETLHPSSIQGQKTIAKQLLTLYFTQLFSPHGIFLDLRANHFSHEASVLKWHPSAFWTKFDKEFRLGLLDVYEGFYLGNDELYFTGMERIGLIKKGFSLEDKKVLGNLFKAHFGEALSKEMKFDLEHFKSSIIKMSEFMLNKKVKISKDFLYLGIYLVTLYSVLEETQEALPVKEIYLDVKKRFSRDSLQL